MSQDASETERANDGVSPPPRNVFEIRLLADSVLQLAQWTNEIPLIQGLRVRNLCEHAISEVTLEIRSDHPAIRASSHALGHLQPGEERQKEGLALAIAQTELRRRTESEMAELTLIISGRMTPIEGSEAIVSPEDGTLAQSEATIRVEVLPWNAWPGLLSLPELLAAFVLPTDPSTQRLLSFARGPLRELTGRDAFLGYGTDQGPSAREVFKALFAAARELSFAELPLARDYRERGALLHLPGDLMESRLGTSLDLSLLLAGALEAAGFDAALILLKSRALVAVWAKGTPFVQPVQDCGRAIENRCQLGELLCLDPGTLFLREAQSFEDAEAKATRALKTEGDDLLLIDARAARGARVRPIATLKPLTEEPEYAGWSPASAVQESDPVASRVAESHSLEERTTFDSPREKSQPTTASESSLPPKIESWKRKLLDLSLLNRLLNFRPGRRSLRLVLGDLAGLQDRLSAGQSFDLHSVFERFAAEGPRARDEVLARAPDHEIEQGDLDLSRGLLFTDESDEELKRRATALFREARTLEQESGSNGLQLCLGFLRWRDPKAKGTGRLAPIILCPMTLERHHKDSFRLKASGEEERLNDTLLEKLRKDFGLNLESLDPPPTDEEGIDVLGTFQRLREVIKDLPQFEIILEAQLALLQFSGHVLWRDLDRHAERLLEAQPLRRLLALDPTGAQTPLPHPSELEPELEPGHLICPLDADSSQLTAVLAASRAQSFVLQGPPGTGKSQTITNIIAHAIATNRTVLFVAEKAAALEVVQRRLEEVGLGKACLAIHSHKVSKKDVLEQIRSAIDEDELHSKPSDPELLPRLRKRRDALLKTREALSQRHANGLSLHEVLSRLSHLGPGPGIAPKSPTPLLSTAAEWRARADATAEVKRAAEGLRAAASSPFGPLALNGAEGYAQFLREHPFRGTRPRAMTRTDQRAFESALAALQHATTEAATAARALRDHLVPQEALWAKRPLGPAAAGAEQKIAEVLAESPGIPIAFIEAAANPKTRPALESLIALGEAKTALAAELGQRMRPSFFLRDAEALRRAWIDASRAIWPLSIWRERNIVKELMADQAQNQAALRFEECGPLLERLVAHGEAKRNFEAALDPQRSALDGFLQGPESTLDRARLQEALNLTARAEGAIRNAGLERGPLADALLHHLQHEMPKATRGSLRALSEALQAFEQCLADLLASLNASREEGPFRAQECFDALTRKLDDLSAHKEALLPYARFQTALEAAEECGAGAIEEALESGQLLPADLEVAGLRGHLEQFADAALASDPDLARFERGREEAYAEEFRTLDKELLLAHRRTAAVAAAQRRAEALEQADPTELTLLRRELKKQRAHLPIRRLFEGLPTLLPRLKPCLLLSPLSVAQYLSPDWRADLIIMDEASQITVEDAIGALGRAHTAVIVGDSRQLPPTSFFQRMATEEELEAESETADLESILDECTATGFPNLELAWHYRSRHESLIAFSNERFYDRRLLTFPSAAHRIEGLGLKLKAVTDGYYDRAGTATHRAEAESVVLEIRRRVKSGKGASSIGVVAFSKAQASLIEDLLDEARATDPALDQALRAGDDPLFVKNLENVQGDERDAILFSIAYGPDKSGKVALNFGPLSQSGGERRLNVAITRARKELVVFTSLKPEDIDLRRTRAKGPEALRRFLEFARSLESELQDGESGSRRPRQDDFAGQLREALSESGLNVDRDIGSSPARVDLGVRDPNHPGRYLLAIETDTPRVLAGATTRDRERTRPSVLQGLGWRLLRAYALDWWRDPARVRAELLAAVAEAEAQSAASPCAAIAPQPLEAEAALAPSKPAVIEVPEVAPPSPLESSPSVSSEAEIQSPVASVVSPPLPSSTADLIESEPIVPLASPAELAAESPGVSPEGSVAQAQKDIDEEASYDEEPGDDAPENDSPTDELRSRLSETAPIALESYRLYEEAGSRDWLEATQSAELEGFLSRIIACEAPIEEELLFERARVLCGIGRRGDRIQQRLQRALRHLAKASVQKRGTTLWRLDQDPDAYAQLRLPSEDPRTRRSPEDIPLAELVNALSAWLSVEAQWSEEDLLRAALRSFGFAKLGAQIRKPLDAALAIVLSRGLFQRDGEIIRRRQV